MDSKKSKRRNKQKPLKDKSLIVEPIELSISSDKIQHTANDSHTQVEHKDSKPAVANAKPEVAESNAVQQAVKENTVSASHVNAVSNESLKAVVNAKPGVAESNAIRQTVEENTVSASRENTVSIESLKSDLAERSDVTPVVKNESSQEKSQDKTANLEKPGDDSKVKSKGKMENCQKKTQDELAVDGSALVQKSKTDIRKERREKQEAQRAAKQAKQAEKQTAAASAPKGQQQPKPQQQKTAQRAQETEHQTPAKKMQQAADAKLRVPDNMQLDDEKTASRVAKKLERKHIPTRSQHQKKVSLFKHLHQYEQNTSLTSAVPINSGHIHPAVLKLGLQYAHGVITGSKARCVALLKVLKEVIDDYQTPDNKDLARDLDTHLSPFITFLNQCRQHSVSMGNAIKYLKHHINKTPSDCPEEEAKENLKDVIDKFYRERILLAAKTISEFTYGVIEDEDVILVYSCSSLVRKVLAETHLKGKRFSVIVVDARPKLEGVSMMNYLRDFGIKCSYIHINAVSYVMPKVTKVFLGAHAILANGYVMSRIGSAQVCLIAKVFNVVVFVCCESYKFCDRVQPDSFVFNELGDPDDLAKVGGRTTELAEWRSIPSLYLLNLLYDVTPHELVTLVITDVGVILPTSVPMVLRVKNPEAYY